MDANGINLRLLTGGTKDDGHISWSPDGKKIAFESRRPGSTGIYVIGADGNNLKRLTPFDLAEFDFQPSWSPDGLRMTFMSVRPGNQEVYLMNADGTNPFRITFNDGGGDLSKSQDVLPSWASFRRIGVARVGAPVSRKMTLLNRDRVPLTVSNILSSDSQFTVSPTNFTLDFGQSREVTVTFTPSSAGFKHATLTLLSNDARSPAATLTVNGTGDATPPAAPTGLTAALAGNQQISLKWRANTDPDLSHYVVYRSASSGFVPGPADSVARVNRPDTTFTSAFEPGTHYFKVVAVDGVGNPSAASNEASVEVPVPLQPSDLLIAGKIAYASTGGASSGIYAANPDGSDPKQLTISPTSDAAPSWSPDGTKIAFYSSRDGNVDIYVVNADGTNQTRLTDHPAQDLYPSWSPDGTKIVFSSNRDSNYEIYAMSADGSNQARLTTHPGDDYWPTWSPDGTKIAFDSYRDDNFEIYVMDVNGDNPKRLTAHPELDREPSWSPDGTKIAFHSSRSGYPEAIYVMGADGSNPTPVNLTTRGSQPSWSPDGTKIAFIGGGGLSTMNQDGSVPAVILPDAFSKSAPSWGEAFRHIGSAGVGASVSRTVTVQNRGTVTLVVTGITSSDPQFTVAPASFSVSSGASREVQVTFRPTSAGVKYATLTITSNDQTSPTARLMVNGSDTPFTDVAVAAGVNDGGDSQGVAWGDYDSDGDQDLYVANNGNIRLYRNDGQGRFTEATVRAGMEDGGNGTGVAWGDYDNDGYLDLFAANNGENWLFRSNGDSTFTNVMRSARVNDRGTQTGAAWGDFDSDGDLDLYVASNDRPNRLYRNNRDGTFTNVADSAEVADTGNTQGVSWGDYDNDGDLDLYTVKVFQPNRLYRNNGRGAFTDVGTLAGVSDGAFGRGAAWGDYDNDGDLDLYVVNSGPNRLYWNNGNGTFTNVGDSAGVADIGDGYGCAWGDFDNDGDLDLYVVNSGSPHRLYRNDGNGKFTDIAASSGVTERGPGGFIAAWGDYDNDGDLDMYVAISGRANRLYRNAGNANRWLHVRLVGTVSNRSGIGAQVTAVTGAT